MLLYVGDGIDVLLFLKHDCCGFSLIFLHFFIDCADPDQTTH